MFDKIEPTNFQLYIATFGRAPENADSNYWLNDLDKGYIERPLFILAIINGA